MKRSEILERYWAEFLLFILSLKGENADYFSNMISEKNHEYAFWNWILEYKREVLK